MPCVPWLQENLSSKLYFGCKAHFINFQQHTDDYRSKNFQQRPSHVFGVQHYGGNTLTAAFIHRCPQYSRHRGGMLPRFHNVCKAGNCSLLSLLIAPRNDGQRTKTNLSLVLPLDWKWCHWVEKVVAFLHTGDKEAFVSPFSHHQFRIKTVILHQARNSDPDIDQVMIMKTPSA